MSTRGDHRHVRAALPGSPSLGCHRGRRTPARGRLLVMTTPTRGFFGRRRERDPRLPPGQYDVGADWPVLTAEPTPRIAPETWSISVDGKVANPTTWTWDEAHQLPGSEYRGAIHCVTTWSKFDTWFAGVSVDTLLEAAQPTEDAHFVMATSKTGYTTNLPLEDVTGGKAWVVWDFDGKPLPTEHCGPGGPRRAPVRCPPSTAGWCVCSCRTCTSERAPIVSPG